MAAQLAQAHPDSHTSSQADKSTYTHQFRWDSSVPEQVLVKGSFDQWTSAIELIKEPSGKFGRSIELDYGSKVLYKYVVDGNWRHNPNEPTETDSNGNVNNLFEVPQYVAPSPSPEPTSEEDLPTDSQTPMPQPQSTPHTPDHAVPDPNQASTLIPGALPNTATFPASPFSDPPSPSSRSVRTSVRSPHLLKQRANSTVSATPGRFRRTSYHSSLLLGSSTAPGTPADKSSPARTSVSTVVSAMAGAAATAIPAAIFAVTGKDLMAGSSSKAMPEDISTGAFSDNSLDQNANLKPADKLPQEKSTGVDPDEDTDAKPADKPQLTLPPPEENHPGLILNDPKENTDGKPAETHLPLPPSEETPPSVLLNDPKENTDGKPADTHIPLPPSEHDNDGLTKPDPIAEPVVVPVVSESTIATLLAPPIAEPITPAIIESPVPNPESVVPQTTEAAVAPIGATAEPTDSQPTPTEPEPAPTEPRSTLPVTTQSASDPATGTDSPSPGKAKYGSLSQNRRSSNGTPKSGGWRASVGSLGRRQSGVGERSGSESLAAETPERKRKTSFFQKIKIAFSPGHRNSPSSGGTDH